MILDADGGRIVDVNPYLIEMLAYSKEELLGKELWEIGVFKDIAASRASFAELQRQLPGDVSAKVLSARLKELETLNMVARDDKGTTFRLRLTGRALNAGMSRRFRCGIEISRCYRTPEETPLVSGRGGHVRQL